MHMHLEFHTYIEIIKNLETLMFHLNILFLLQQVELLKLQLIKE